MESLAPSPSTCLDQSLKRVSRIAVASGMIDSQEESGAFEMVTKSAVMKMLVTPAMPSSPAANGSSGLDPATNVWGPPTGCPTENFAAFGFGVGATLTGIGHRG
jgi:hypothetical protein